jgi:Spy/CpxP family protein refolding chaperone
MKLTLLAISAGLLLAVSGCSQSYGRAHGMMWGDGTGYRHGGYGMNAEMMEGDDGPEGDGMGPGMMRGGGPGYGRGGNDMNHGMMGEGYGPDGYSMGSGMMWGGGAPLNLTEEQRAKIAEIQKEVRAKQWALMEKMHEQGWRSGGFARDGQFDEPAARKAYDAMTDLRKQMFENSLAVRKRIDSVLTPQQREQIHRGRR